MEKIRVRVLKDDGWAKKGDIHQVYNCVTFKWPYGPYFEVIKNKLGIKVSNCEILRPLKEYTMEELFELVGHEFIIKES